MQPTSLPENAQAVPAGLLWRAGALAWGLALAATLGAVFIGEVMGLAPCVLCWYQRIAMFPIVVVLGVPLMVSEHPQALRSAAWSAAVLTALGWLVASYHLALHWGWIAPTITPCGAGPSCRDTVLQIFGFLDVPLLSWLAFTGIGLALMVALRSATDAGVDE
jgi:disulfide bond formation protein DsbB